MAQLNFGDGQTAEMRVVQVQWHDRPALRVTLRDITERKRAEQRMTYLARHDALTGLVDRQRFYEETDMAIARVERKQSPFDHVIRGPRSIETRQRYL
jgi:PleD family two-component response regulator